jgi:hypothetical protein
MLTCKALTQHHANDYFDHQFTPRQRFGVRVHLMLCRHCGRFVKQLLVVRYVLRRSRAPTGETQVLSIAEKLHRTC